MPFTFNEVNNMPDIATTDRYKVFYPPIPGVNTKMLSLLTAHLTVPQKAVGQIIVKIGDQSIGFRGGLQFENQIQITFKENVRADVTKSMKNWFNLVRNRDGISALKSQYSGEGRIEIYDTMGKIFITIPLLSMFPVVQEFPELNDEQTTAFEYNITFNVDYGEPI